MFMGQFNNPYMQVDSQFPVMNNPMLQPNMLPRQKVIEVNGKASVDTIRLAPNSSILCMDITAPIVWLCVSDGIGNVTSTPYDVKLHQEQAVEETNSLEQRLLAIEQKISDMEGKIDVKSDVSKPKSKQNYPSNNNN